MDTRQPVYLSTKTRIKKYAGDLKIMTWNIDASFREQAATDDSGQPNKFTVAARRERIMKMILEHSADVIMLQELRFREHNAWLISQLISAGYEVAYGWRNPTEFSMACLVAWNPQKLFASGSQNYQLLSDDVKIPGSYFGTWGANMFCVELYICDDQKVVWPPRKLTVGSVHFPMSTEEKVSAAYKMQDILLGWKEQDKDMQFIIGGDFNYFADKNENHIKDLKACFSVVEPRGVDYYGNPTAGSFVGYSHDEFCADPESPNHLDYFVHSQDLVCSEPLIDNRTLKYNSSDAIQSTDRDDLPSDHLPMIVYLA